MLFPLVLPVVWSASSASYLCVFYRSQRVSSASAKWRASLWEESVKDGVHAAKGFFSLSLSIFFLFFPSFLPSTLFPFPLFPFPLFPFPLFPFPLFPFPLFPFPYFILIYFFYPVFFLQPCSFSPSSSLPWLQKPQPLLLWSDSKNMYRGCSAQRTREGIAAKGDSCMAPPGPCALVCFKIDLQLRRKKNKDVVTERDTHLYAM